MPPKNAIILEKPPCRPLKKKLAGIIAQRKKAHAFYLKKSKVYQAFLEMERQTYAEGALSQKTKELIAVGISVVINRESCMEWHTGQALACGATADEVLEAVGVGMEMSGGPGTVAARFAMNVLEHHDAAE